MSEQFKEKSFSIDIDKLLNGSDYTKAEHNYGGLLELAKTVAAVDYSTDSKIRQGLLDKLLLQMAEKEPHGFACSKADELNEDELAQVAGGRVLSGPEQGCTLCGCRRGAASIKDETCPDCGHPRYGHQ